jgi:hypothetical protein
MLVAECMHLTHSMWLHRMEDPPKRHRSKKPVDAPKRPKSAYMFFLAEFRENWKVWQRRSRSASADAASVRVSSHMHMRERCLQVTGTHFGIHQQCIHWIGVLHMPHQRWTHARVSGHMGVWVQIRSVSATTELHPNPQALNAGHSCRTEMPAEPQRRTRLWSNHPSNRTVWSQHATRCSMGCVLPAFRRPWKRPRNHCNLHAGTVPDNHCMLAPCLTCQPDRPLLLRLLPLQKDNPESRKVADVAKAAGEVWRDLPADQKAVYEVKSTRAKASARPCTPALHCCAALLRCTAVRCPKGRLRANHPARQVQGQLVIQPQVSHAADVVQAEACAG